MKNIKKYAAILTIALISGAGIFGLVKAIDAQTNSNLTVQKEQKEAKENPNENEENEAAENDGEENEADENEAEDDEQNEAAEKAEQAALAKEAKITREQAEAIALNKVQGKIVEGEMEREEGRLIYSFDIKKADKTMFDVEVDANTGEVLKAQPDDDDGEDEGSETDTQ